MLTRLGPPLTVFLLAGPILFGLAGTVLPAFGYLPALGGNEFTLAYFADFLARPGIDGSIGLSFLAGIASAGISLLVVMFFVAAWAGTRVFSRLQHLVSPLLSVPHAAAAFGLAFLIAPSGMIARLVSPELTGWTRPPDIAVVNDPMGLAMIAGLVVKEIPFLLLVTLAAMPQVRLAETRMLAASLGYGRVAGFLLLAWPAIYAQIRLAVFAVIAFASSVVDVAMILGPTTPPTLAVRLLQWMNSPDLSMRYLASAGALAQLAVTAAALAAWIGIERLGALLRNHLALRGRRFRHDAPARHGALAAMSVSALVVFAGLATLAIWSVSGFWKFPDTLPQSFTLKTWMTATPRIFSPLATTLVVAVAATIAAVILAILCLRREDETGRRPGRWALFLVYLPLIVPQAAFLFGLQLLFILTGTMASLPALILGHLVFVMPYVFLSLSDPWRAHDRRYEAIAAGLGRKRSETFWKVKLPMLLRTVLIAGAVGFAVSIGQYLPTVLIGAGRLATVTTEAVALASGGNRRVIGVYAFLQMLLPTLGFLVATALPAMLFRRRRAMRI
ncbi:ABC transporter permease [Aquamicrobium sp. LC103]|uniref:ABC transporter permease n=1 Tax=Aquamicrobium sp. LC103 TaxID=1120658 RepID=UPI00063E8AE4|nr:ABC transporter permease [Aquamicrobium sp. LC103]TKT82610.1 ABC transporter permease [Aquamicrobium sp. LC103]